MAAELSKICFCIITMLLVTLASSANDTMPTDEEVLFTASSPSPYSEPSESGEDSSLSSDASEYSPAPTPYIDALTAETEEEQLDLAPDYSPSPTPYIEVEAPEVYELYSPTEAPAPEPSSVFEADQLPDSEPGSPDSEVSELYTPLDGLEAPAPEPSSVVESDQLPDSEPGSADSEVSELYSPTEAPAPELSSVFESDQSSDSEPGSPDSDVAPNPTVSLSSYRAEDEDVDFDDEYYSSDQSSNKATMVGFVLGSVCLVGLGGLVVKKKKYNKSKADYDYELAKREDV